MAYGALRWEPNYFVDILFSLKQSHHEVFPQRYFNRSSNGHTGYGGNIQEGPPIDAFAYVFSGWHNLARKPENKG